MTELDVRDALEDCALVDTLWTRLEWGQKQDEEAAFEAALASFDERRPHATMFRRNAFKRAFMLVSSLAKAHKAPTTAGQSVTQSDLATALRQHEARLKRLQRALRSALSCGYFDSSRLLVTDIQSLISRYGYVCSCHCAFCVRSHGTAPRVFLWHALLVQHVADSRSNAKPVPTTLHAPSVPPTLDGAEELADIIAGAMTDQ